MTYIGNEQLSVGGNKIDLTVNDFWRRSYSDINSSKCRNDFAEFLVSSSLDMVADDHRHSFSGRYDFISPSGYKIDVRAAAYTQSEDGEQPDRISFRISAPIGNDKRQSDVYVFCVYKGLIAVDSPLNTDLWDFYVLPTSLLNEKLPFRKTITFPSLLKLGPLWCDYYGIEDAIQKA
ncbi:MAG: hypothetical protein LUC95_01960, partial [Lachnospiraceae bacterium]|nr:hypothetical protein [Lachnospiraceae bacterium]